MGFADAFVYGTHLFSLHVHSLKNHQRAGDEILVKEVGLASGVQTVLVDSCVETPSSGWTPSLFSSLLKRRRPVRSCHSHNSGRSQDRPQRRFEHVTEKTGIMLFRRPKRFSAYVS
jgi:hypothetical protein